jgi:gp32 DNA binding protein like
MTNSFEALRQNRKANFDKLTSELNKLNQGSTNQENSKNDERFWKPDVDKAGNGYAIIRFLPAPAGEDVPFVRIWDHGFQGPGGWYIEKSLTTFGKPDPVSEYNKKLWDSGIESNKDIVRKQKRRLSYFSNIYVVKDPTRPDNEGKVFLFKYGKKIFDKLNEAMYPQFADEKAINPFDLWDGANFKLKVRKLDGYPNYDKSELDNPGPLLQDDDAMEKIWKSQYSLQELLDPKHFKSYEELKMRFEKTLGAGNDYSPSSSSSRQEVDEDEAFPVPPKAAPVKEAPKQSAPWDDDEDEDLSFFKKLASAD